jgi:hypothetical protein
MAATIANDARLSRKRREQNAARGCSIMIALMAFLLSFFLINKSSAFTNGVDDFMNVQQNRTHP